MDSTTLAAPIAKTLQLSKNQVAGTIRLLEEGATIPFIARYRKEATGNLDETSIIAIRDTLSKLRELHGRRSSILNTLQEQGNLTPELEQSIREAATLAELEDLYLPYRPKRKTRGSIARSKGLAPLAELLLKQEETDPLEAAQRFVDPEAGVETAEEALAGARDIIAEEVNEDSTIRSELRALFEERALLQSTVIKKKKQQALEKKTSQQETTHQQSGKQKVSHQQVRKYEDYFDWSEPARKAPSHRVLAILRGAKEGFLTVHILPPEEEALAILFRRYVKHDLAAASPAHHARRKESGSRIATCRAQIEAGLTDAYKRLLAPSLENEMRKKLKDRADTEAIAVFSSNVRELLMAPPLGQRATMGIDPGYRTGCKLACLNTQGNFQESATIYPLEPHNKTGESAATLHQLVDRHAIEAIAVGDGTGGREMLDFVEGLDFGREVITVAVDEDGASVYSASENGRKEFPDLDVTVRGAISIGRRLMDPLSELVKIDPRSIGVGQYQHDVDAGELQQALDDVVTSCVNAVGVELNNAGRELLTYVSGLSSGLAENLVAYRAEHGPFSSRQELRSVPGLGAKTFEQAAGFLRIRDGKHPLDTSAVHPEQYPLVEQMAGDAGVTVDELMADRKLRASIDINWYLSETVGLPTLQDIMQELDKPGRDPRENFEPFRFSDEIHSIDDVEEGMVLPGLVTNVTNFGAFVDIGAHQDGLVHISELSHQYVSNPHTVVKVNQKVTVKVISIDRERARIGLSMKQAQGIRNVY